jgi:N-acetylglutamate synthase
MKSPGGLELFETVDATWAPLAIHNHEGWLIREGAGGGQRVSAATLLDGVKNAKIGSAAKKMLSIGQNPLFMVRNSDMKLDAELEALGYVIIDPVAILTAPIDRLIQKQPKQTHYVDRLIAPNEKAAKIWAKGGIDQNRLNVMQRVCCPKTILSAGDMGVAFAAAYGDIAMVHAIEVANNHRRKGIANALMFEALNWAKDQNCKWVSVLTVRKNLPAHKLYEALGMTEAAAYHYRSYVSN